MQTLGIQIVKISFIIGHLVLTTALAQEGLAVIRGYEQNNSALPHLPTLQLAGEAAATKPLWEEGKGRATVTLSNRSLDNPHYNSLDLLLPLCHTEEKLLLIQGGLHHRDKEATWTLGIGQRHFQVQDTVGYWGYNLFYDHQQQGHHQRLSAGVEGRFHAITGSFNGYFPISHKQITADQRSWVAPVRGLSLHLGYQLAHAPHWGFTLVGEHYFWTFLKQDLDNRQQYQNPNTMTLGIDYTPCPLITASYGFKLREDNQWVHQLQLALNFHLGLSLARHLDSRPADSTPLSLANRLALIQRRSQVILQQRPYNKPVSAGVQEEQASNPQKIQQQDQDVDLDLEESADWPDTNTQLFNSQLSIKQEELLNNIKKYYCDNITMDKKLLNESLTKLVINAQKEYLDHAMATLDNYATKMSDGQYLKKCVILGEEHTKLNSENHKLEVSTHIDDCLTQRSSSWKNCGVEVRFVDIALYPLK